MCRAHETKTPFRMPFRSSARCRPADLAGPNGSDNDLDPVAIDAHVRDPGDVEEPDFVAHAILLNRPDPTRSIGAVVAAKMAR
jgi:hypothetical protein